MSPSGIKKADGYGDPDTVTLKSENEVPQRIVAKENSLGSLFSAITVDSFDSSFSESATLSNSKRFQSELTPTLEVSNKAMSLPERKPSIGHLGNKKSRLRERSKNRERPRRCATSPTRLNGKAEEAPLRPERQPSAGKLEGKIKQKRKNDSIKLNCHSPVRKPERIPSDGILSDQGGRVKERKERSDEPPQQNEIFDIASPKKPASLSRLSPLRYLKPFL